MLTSKGLQVNCNKPFSAETGVTGEDLDPSFLSQPTNAFHPLYLNRQQQQPLPATSKSSTGTVKVSKRCHKIKFSKCINFKGPYESWDSIVSMRSDDNSLVEPQSITPMCLRNQWILVGLDQVGAPIFNTIVSQPQY